MTVCEWRRVLDSLPRPVIDLLIALSPDVHPQSTNAPGVLLPRITHCTINGVEVRAQDYEAWLHSLR